MRKFDSTPFLNQSLRSYSKKSFDVAIPEKCTKKLYIKAQNGPSSIKYSRNRQDYNEKSEYFPNKIINLNTIKKNQHITGNNPFSNSIRNSSKIEKKLPFKSTRNETFDNYNTQGMRIKENRFHWLDRSDRKNYSEANILNISNNILGIF